MMMRRNFTGCLQLLFLVAANNAFQMPSSLPFTQYSNSKKYSNIIEAANVLLDAPLSATTALHGKLWKRLQIEEGT